MDDEYPTCARTYVTLCIYPDRLNPEDITARLAIEPSRWQRRGAVNLGSKRAIPAKLHGWFLSSEGIVESRDIRQHLDWLLTQIGPKFDVIRALQAENCRMDVSCYWVSRSGHGGPTMMPVHMEMLAKLGLEMWFDVYCGADDVESDEAE